MLLKMICVGLRILLGGGFLFLGIQKLRDPEFLFGGLLHQAQEVGRPFPIYVRFLQRFVELNQEPFAYMIAVGEILVGLSFLLGALVSLGAVGGTFLVLNFALATTWGNLPMMIAHLGLVSLILLVGYRRAGLTLGLDGWLINYVHEAIVLFPLRRSAPVNPVRLVKPPPPRRR